MDKIAYHIEIAKDRIPTSLFQYPCEEISDKIIDDRRVHIYGNPIKGFPILSNCDIEECSDLIIMPSGINCNEDCIEKYYEELFYYQNPILGNNRVKAGTIKNIIFLLPYGASHYSTNYIKMADYAIVGYVKGLSKQAAYQGNGVYCVILPEGNVDMASLKHLLLYLLSSNSNHLVCNIIRLDR